MKIRNLIIAGFCSLGVLSCNFLDFDETNGGNSEEDMYALFGTVKQMLTNVYSSMPSYAGFTSATADGLAMRDCASDDAEYGITNATIQNVNNGTWSATNTFDDAWSLYGGIRAANAFLKNFETVDLSRFSSLASYENQMKQLQYYPYEARVLRAYYFFELARRYGDIAMPLEVLTTHEANEIVQTPFDEVVAFIAAECTECAANLPLTYSNVPQSEIGRVTKGFALALKTKALLYAASPLHNAGDAEKWKAAARAAKEVIDLDFYKLDPAYINNTTSSELILARMNAAAQPFELYNFPYRFTFGNRAVALVASGNYPTQNLVDAFETANGYKVTLGSNGWQSDDPAFDPANPYDHRDPRFARTILADGMPFKNGTIETFVGGADDRAVSLGGSATGYFVRKYLQENANFDPTQTGSAAYMHHWVLYRYAETLLSYAEAMVNAFGSGTYTDGEFTLSALEALNQVRANASMPAVSGGSKEDLLERIRNEWRVEFAFEDHRFWDVRRWKLDPSATQTTIYGVQVVRGASGVKSYYRRLVETRTWRDAMYLYPIPQSELFKNTNLVQNVGW